MSSQLSVPRLSSRTPVQPAGIVLVILVVLGVVGFAVHQLTTINYRAPSNPVHIPAPPRNPFARKPETATAPLWAKYEKGSGEKVVPDEDRPKIEALLEAFVDADRKADGKAYVALIHLPRLLAECERIRSIKPLDTVESQERSIGSLSGGYSMDTSLNQLGFVGRWEDLEIRSVDFDVPRGEAVARAIISRIGSGSSVYRFWVIKEAEGWKVFDWQDVGYGPPESRTIHEGFSVLPGIGTFAFSEAEKLLEKGDAEGALAKSKTLDTPLYGQMSPSLEILQMQALRKLGRRAEALAVIEKALVKHADYPVLHAFRREILVELGREAEAKKEREEFARLVGDAIEDFDRAPQPGKRKPAPVAKTPAAPRVSPPADPVPEVDPLRNPDLDVKQFDQAVKLLGEGKVAEATDLFLKTCKSASAFGRYFRDSCDELERAGQYEAQLKVAEAYLKRSPEDEDAYFWQGRALGCLKRFRDAEFAYRKGLEKSPKARKFRFWNELAGVLMFKGELDEATEYVERALKEAPENIDSLYFRMMIRVRQKNVLGALDDMDRVLAMRPDLADLYEKHADFESLRGDPRFAQIIAKRRPK